MNVDSARLFAMAIAIGIGVVGPALAMGLIAGRGLEAIGRNPETENSVRNTMVLALAFCESLAIFALVVALIIKFV